MSAVSIEFGQIAHIIGLHLQKLHKLCKHQPELDPRSTTSERPRIDRCHVLRRPRRLRRTHGCGEPMFSGVPSFCSNMGCVDPCNLDSGNARTAAMRARKPGRSSATARWSARWPVDGANDTHERKRGSDNAQFPWPLGQRSRAKHSRAAPAHGRRTPGFRGNGRPEEAKPTPPSATPPKKPKSERPTPPQRRRRSPRANPKGGRRKDGDRGRRMTAAQTSAGGARDART